MQVRPGGVSGVAQMGKHVTFAHVVARAQRDRPRNAMRIAGITVCADVEHQVISGIVDQGVEHHIACIAMVFGLAVFNLYDRAIRYRVERTAVVEIRGVHLGVADIELGERVVVIGGGNVAMDAARCALRAGAKKVSIVYRRTRAEAPARVEELENAYEEGIDFRYLTNPLRFLADSRGWVAAMECIEMELGEPDAKGRRRPIPKLGSEFVLEADTVVVSLGTTPNPLVPASTPGLNTKQEGTVVIDNSTGRTTKPGVWAGGDVATGSATVISAMGAARIAASDMDSYLRLKVAANWQ